MTVPVIESEFWNSALSIQHRKQMQKTFTDAYK